MGRRRRRWRRAALGVLVVSRPALGGGADAWCEAWQRADDGGLGARARNRSTHLLNRLPPADFATASAVRWPATPDDDDDEGVWIGSIFGVPMLAARLESERLAPLARWAAREERRRRKARSRVVPYNALAEALEAPNDAALVDAATYVADALKDALPRLVRRVRQRTVDDEADDPAARACAVSHVRAIDDAAELPPGVAFRSWVVALRYGDVAGKGDRVDFHAHRVDFHASLLFEANSPPGLSESPGELQSTHRGNSTVHAWAAATGTPPPRRPLFTLSSPAAVLALLPGGLEHAVPPLVFADSNKKKKTTPRTTTTAEGPATSATAAPVVPRRLGMAFDLDYSLDQYGRLLSHPGVPESAARPRRRLDDVHDAWAPLIDADDLRRRLGGAPPLAVVQRRPKTTTTAQRTTTTPGVVSHEGEAAPSEAAAPEETVWGGVVDLAALLESVTSPNLAST